MNQSSSGIDNDLDNCGGGGGANDDDDDDNDDERCQ